MEKCIHCGADTELFDNGKPICLTCEAQREAKLAEQRLRPSGRSDVFAGKSEEQEST